MTKQRVLSTSLAASLVLLTACGGSGDSPAAGATIPVTTASEITTTQPATTAAVTSPPSSTTTSTSTTPTSTTTPVESLDSLWDPRQDAVDVLPGRYSTSVVGGSISLTVPEPLQLLDHSRSLVVLAPGSDGYAGRNLLILTKVDGYAGPADISDQKTSSTGRVSDFDDLVSASAAVGDWLDGADALAVDAQGELTAGDIVAPWFDIVLSDEAVTFSCELGPSCVNTIHGVGYGYFEAPHYLRFRLYDLGPLPGTEGQRLVAMVQSRTDDQDTMNDLGDGIVGSLEIT